MFYEWVLGAANNVADFVMVDDTNVEVTDLGTSFVVQLRGPSAGSFAAGAGVKSSLGNGWYRYIPTAGECASAGMVDLVVTAAGCQQQNLLARVGGDPLRAIVPGPYESGSAGGVLGRLASTQVTVVSPVSAARTITLVYGDDYLAADGRALDFSAASWPTLTGGTVVMKVDAATLTSINGSVVDADTVRVEIPKATVMALGRGTFDYDIEATLSNGHAVTLVSGKLTVAPDVR